MKRDDEMQAQQRTSLENSNVKLAQDKEHQLIQLLSAREEVARLQELLKESNAKCDDEQRQRKQLQDESDVAASAVAASKAAMYRELDTLKMEVKRVQTAKSAAEDERTDMQSKLQTIETAGSLAQSEARSTIEVLRVEIKSLNAKMQALKASEASIAKERAAFHSKQLVSCALAHGAQRWLPCVHTVC